VPPNINDDFVGAAPDLGCYERGKAAPAYGPRALVSVSVPEAKGVMTSGLRLLSPRPNPARGAVTFAILADRPVRASVRIVDIAGRTIRSIIEEREFVSGTHTLTWDGRDEANARMPSGIYAIEVRSGGTVWTRNLTLLR
jgi:flagellar hook assembly protein FlgD